MVQCGQVGQVDRELGRFGKEFLLGAEVADDQRRIDATSEATARNVVLW